MTALIDKHLQAAPPTPADPDEPTPVTGTPTDPKALAERVARWKEIEAAGGIESWVEKQLRAKNLLVEDEDSDDEDEDEDSEDSDDGDDGDGDDEDSDDEDSDDEDSDDEDEEPAPRRAAKKAAKPAKAAMSDSQKRDFKERKKAEAAERRVLHRLARQAYTATHITFLGQGVFWTDDESDDEFDHPQREATAQALQLTVSSSKQLAESLGVSIPTLRWLAFHREVDTGTHYRRWQVLKRDGVSQRTLSSPKKKLKTAQRWVLRNVLEKLPVHGAAHGFLGARSIVTNAQIHAGAAVVIKVDLKDFFPSITWKRVKGLLRRHGMRESVATLLALLATDSPREQIKFRGKLLHVASGPRSLPQGAPTSPALTNAICLRLDRRVAGLARSLGFRYTRYADDLTFSWHDPPGAQDAGQPGVGALLRGLQKIITDEGFELNPAKTLIMRRGERQSVTGLIVNEAQGAPQVRVPRETLRKLRAAIHNREKGKPGKEGESLDQLRGMAAFIHMTDPVRGRELLDRINKLPQS